MHMLPKFFWLSGLSPSRRKKSDPSARLIVLSAT
jgi:hypothetical protein